jgi:peptide/nickel transport system permease protein
VSGQRPSVLRGLRRPMAMICLGFLLLLTLAAVLAPWISPYDPLDQNLSITLQGPTTSHWLGTDEVGRDIFSRVLYGGRVSLLAGVECVATAMILGVSGGVVAGFFGGWVSKLLDRLSDLLLATPAIIVLLTVLALYGPNITAAMITLGVLLTPDFLRLSRASTLAARAELYVDSAIVSGLTRRRVIVRHILPNVMGPVIIRASTTFGTVLLVETGLSFLGLGVRPPTPSWGGMIAAAGNNIYTQTWYLIPSGGIVTLTILAFNLLGDSIHDATNPVSRFLPRSGTGRVQATTLKLRAAARTPESPPAAASQLLSVRGLEVAFPTPAGWQPVVSGVDFDVAEGETLGFVGESGSGKTMTMLAVLGLVPSPGRVTRGSIVFEGRELLGERNDAGFKSIRGSKIGFVAQEPMVSLDPVFQVGRLIAEPMRHHLSISHKEANRRVLELLELVGLPDPRASAASYPHQLSGGMAQRVSIALALGCGPKLLVADEPTTALDVTIQAEILDLFRRLQQELSMAVVLVTHNLGVLADFCTSAVVMYAGQVVERGTVADVLGRPFMPYTYGLLRSDPHRATPGARLPAIPGTVPTPAEWPEGCHFQARCPMAIDACRTTSIEMWAADPGHEARCLRSAEIASPRIAPL